jgi:hypothetical protein
VGYFAGLDVSLEEAAICIVLPTSNRAVCGRHLQFRRTPPFGLDVLVTRRSRAVSPASDMGCRSGLCGSSGFRGSHPFSFLSRDR